MKDFFERLLSDDETRLNFTKYEMVVFGVLVPVCFFIVMAVAGWIGKAAGL